MVYFQLIGFWPLINFVQSNFSKLTDYTDILILVLFVMVSCFVLGTLIRKYSKQPISRYYLLFLVLTAALFNYGFVVDSLPFLKNSYLKASYVWLLLTILIGFGAWRLSQSSEIQKASKLLIIVVVAIPILEIADNQWIEFKNPTRGDHPVQDMSFSFKHKPNVYYIMVDAYARQDTLKEVGGFDNEPFLHQLEDRGFLVSRNALSNYHFTTASLSATMNLGYHPYNQDGTLDPKPMYEAIKGNNQARRIFKKNGYKIINIPSHWYQFSCSGYEDKCIRKLRHEVYQKYLSKTPARYCFEKIVDLKGGYVDFKDIMGTVKIYLQQPKLIYAHIAHVHDAIYDDGGNYKSPLHPGFSNISEAQRYISTIKVINKKLLSAIDYIKKHDRNSIVIVQADHGPTYTGNLNPKNIAYWIERSDSIRLKERDDFRYAFGILSAVYLPPSIQGGQAIRQYLLGKPTLVNLFRYLFAYLSEEEPTPLEDNTHFLYFDQKTNVYREDNINHLKP